MHTVIRTYSGKGAKELMDVLERNKGEVEKLIRGIKGFVSFSLVRTTDGGFSVSVFNDKGGTDESVGVARDWIAKNASNTGVTAPRDFVRTVNSGAPARCCCGWRRKTSTFPTHRTAGHSQPCFHRPFRRNDSRAPLT